MNYDFGSKTQHTILIAQYNVLKIKILEKTGVQPQIFSLFYI